MFPNEDEVQSCTRIKSHLVIDMQNHHDVIKEKLSDEYKKVLILNTGGTISMFPSPQGYVTKTGALKSFFQNSPFCCDQDYTYFKAPEGFLITPLSDYNRRILFKVEELDTLLDSSNMTSKDWVMIAERIEKNYKLYDSFIILHGTDTMAYTASALSFMFQNLSKTIIITGSQVPISQPRNDVFTNFLNALTIAGHFTIPEVLICFQDKLLRGNRAQKVNSSSLDSFDSPRFTPLGYFGVHISIKWDLILKNPNEEELQVNKTFCPHMSLIRLNPLLEHQALNDIFKNEKLKGVVIETYGAGNMQTEEKFRNEIAQAAKKGIIIVNISQCHSSQVEMLYETGIVFEQMGVISGGDMTSEAAFTKLGYLLAQHEDIHQVKQEFQKNIRGELTEQGKGAEAEPFLMALSSAIKQQHSKIDLIKDLVFPNILCQICVQKKPLASLKLSHIDVNYKAQDYDKRTILHVAAREGSLEIAELILRQCPDVVNNLDRWKHSPMYEAVMTKNTQMIQLLLRFSGKLLAPVKELTNLLMQDIANGKTEMLQLYYEAGERDFSQFRTEDNRTIAHLAVSLGNEAVLQFLSNPGVTFDWQIQDVFGRIPKDEKLLQKRLMKR